MERTVQKLDFECDVCKKQFNKRHSLKIHIDRVHEKKLDHECLVCQKRFFYLKDLINHLKAHNKLEKLSPIEYLPEDSRDELAKEGRVFVKEFEVTTTEPFLTWDTESVINMIDHSPQDFPRIGYVSKL